MVKKSKPLATLPKGIQKHIQYKRGIVTAHTNISHFFSVYVRPLFMKKIKLYELEMLLRKRHPKVKNVLIDNFTFYPDILDKTVFFDCYFRGCFFVLGEKGLRTNGKFCTFRGGSFIPTTLLFKVLKKYQDK